MFQKARQLNELRKMRSQALKVRRELEQIEEKLEKDDIKVVVSGDQKITFIQIDGEERKDVMEVINKAMKKVQKEAAKRMMDMGGGLSGLLGKM